MLNIRNYYLLFLPGLLAAMTGVGVGDLATAGFAGAQLGTQVLWAVLVGAAFKYVLSEGVARWQLASGISVLHGAIEHLRWPFIIFMVVYFFPWCWFVGGALINAAGVAGSHLLALFGIAASKELVGIVHTLFALCIILLGKNHLFNGLMSLFAVILFFSVIVCVFYINPPLNEILHGLFVPVIPAQDQGLGWTVALMGGVGGTLTIVCYGYWIANSGRVGLAGLRACRIDLTVSYLLTALFGLSMVVIGAVAGQTGNGLNLLLDISSFFADQVHPWMGILFIIGAWSAIFSSLLGVWQVIPQVFADCYYALRGEKVPLQDIAKTRPFRVWLLILALVPILALEFSFKDVQKWYSMVGALFMPVLAATLLWLNRKQLVTDQFKNGAVVTTVLVTVLLFFLYLAVRKF